MLIFESNLRQIIREELEKRYFGITENYEDLVSELRTLFENLKISNDRKALQSTISEIGAKHGVPRLEFISSGTSRFVLGLGRDLVLKIARGTAADPSVVPAYRKRMNQDDYSMGTDVDLEGAFAKTYAHADDWNWVIAERVKTLQDDEAVVRMFPNDFLPDLQTVRDSRDIDPRVSLAPERFYMEIIQQFLTPDYTTGIEQRSSFRRGILEVVRLKHPRAAEVPVEEMFESFSKLPHFVHLRELIVKYGADPGEIRAGNLGLTSDGRVVLIDSATPGR